MPYLLAIVSLVVSVIAGIAGVLSGLWSIACFAGGPHGQVGTPEAASAGTLFLLIAAVLIAVCWGTWKLAWRLYRREYPKHAA